MNEIQAIKQNELRRIRSKLREQSRELNRFYREYPYCPVCKCRAPLGHTDHIFGCREVG